MNIPTHSSVAQCVYEVTRHAVGQAPTRSNAIAILNNRLIRALQFGLIHLQLRPPMSCGGLLPMLDRLIVVSNRRDETGGHRVCLNNMRPQRRVRDHSQLGNQGVIDLERLLGDRVVEEDASTWGGRFDKHADPNCRVPALRVDLREKTGQYSLRLSFIALLSVPLCRRVLEMKHQYCRTNGDKCSNGLHPSGRIARSQPFPWGAYRGIESHDHESKYRDTECRKDCGGDLISPSFVIGHLIFVGCCYLGIVA